MKTSEYYVLSHYPSRFKSEHVNIGVVAFLSTGEVRVHFVDDLKKLKAIDPDASIEKVRSWENILPEKLIPLDAHQRLEYLRNLGNWKISEHCGRMSFDSEKEYLERISAVLALLETERKRRVASREGTSRLLLDVKDRFMSHGWLGRDITKHEIVTRFPLKEAVTADFALRNGKLHVIETLDLRSSNISEKRKELRSKALVLDVAKKLEPNTATYTIIAGRNSELLHGAKDLLRDYSNELIAWESQDEISSLYNILGTATGKPMLRLQ